MIAIPAPDLMLYVTALDPFVPQHPRHGTVVEPLCPRSKVICQSCRRQDHFAFQNHARPRGIESGAKIGTALVQGIQKNPICLQCTHHLGQRVYIRFGFPPGTCVPRVIININPDTATVTTAHNTSHSMQSAGQIAIKIELVAFIHADARVRLPQHDTVIATKFPVSFIQKTIHRITSGPEVVKLLIPDHDKTAGII